MTVFAKLINDRSNRDIAMLLVGNLAARAIYFGVTPVLTRIYAPADFGLLALFVAIISIAGPVAGARYEMAIPLSRNEADSVAMVLICTLISGGFCAALLAVSITFNGIIVHWTGNPALAPWLIVAPFVVFTMAVVNSLRLYHIRHRNFRPIARTRMYSVTGQSVVSLAIGLIWVGAFGLITGRIAGHLVEFAQLMRSAVASGFRYASLQIKQIVSILRRYRNFPAFSLPATLMNSFSLYLISLVLPVIYNTSLAGQYVMAERMLGLPAVLLGEAVGQTYLEEASRQRRSTGSAGRAFSATLARLLLIVVPLFFGLYFYIVDLFTLVFGQDWKTAGECAKILLPLYAIRTIVSPLSLANVVFERQKVGLAINALLLVMLICAIVTATALNLPLKEMLVLICVGQSCVYLGTLLVVWRISKGAGKLTETIMTMTDPR